MNYNLLSSIKHIENNDFCSFMKEYSFMREYLANDSQLRIIVRTICKYGHLEFLKWIYYLCVDLGFSFTYSAEDVSIASKYGHIRIIKWLESLPMDFKYDYKAIDNAIIYSQISILDLFLRFEKYNNIEFTYTHLIIIECIIVDNILPLTWLYDHKKLNFSNTEFDEVIDFILCDHHYLSLLWFHKHFKHRVQRRINLKGIINDDVKGSKRIIKFLISRNYKISEENISEYFTKRYLGILKLLNKNKHNIREGILEGSKEDKWLKSHEL